MAMKMCDRNVGKRMYEECIRLFDTAKQIQEFFRVSPPLQYHWLNGTAPSAGNLIRLIEAGGDVMYVLTGRRSNAQGKDIHGL